MHQHRHSTYAQHRHRHRHSTGTGTGTAQAQRTWMKSPVISGGEVGSAWAGQITMSTSCWATCAVQPAANSRWV